jgi:hypothetical protein
MSSTITLSKETVVKGSNAQAKIFLVGVDPAKTAGPKPIDPMAVFILNSRDFIDLQKYVQAATALPSTTSLFEAEFPRDGMSKFLAEDPALYDVRYTRVSLSNVVCNADRLLPVHERGSASYASTLLRVPD